MSSWVQLKYISATEGLLSILALERLYPRMPSLVSGEPQNDWRTCHTSRTDKSLFTGVYSCMLLEISGLTKTSTTVMTSIWFLSCICSVRWPKRAFWATVVLICLFRSLDWLNRFPQWSHFKGLPPVRDSSGTLGDRSNCHDLSSIQSHS